MSIVPPTRKNSAAKITTVMMSGASQVFRAPMIRSTRVTQGLALWWREVRMTYQLRSLLV